MLANVASSRQPKLPSALIVLLDLHKTKLALPLVLRAKPAVILLLPHPLTAQSVLLGLTNQLQDNLSAWIVPWASTRKTKGLRSVRMPIFAPKASITNRGSTTLTDRASPARTETPTTNVAVAILRMAWSAKEREIRTLRPAQLVSNAAQRNSPPLNAMVRVLLTSQLAKRVLASALPVKLSLSHALHSPTECAETCIAKSPDATNALQTILARIAIPISSWKRPHAKNAQNAKRRKPSTLVCVTRTKMRK